MESEDDVSPLAAAAAAALLACAASHWSLVMSRPSSAGSASTDPSLAPLLALEGRIADEGADDEEEAVGGPRWRPVLSPLFDSEGPCRRSDLSLLLLRSRGPLLPLGGGPPGG